MAFTIPTAITSPPSSAASGRSRFGAKKVQDQNASCFDEILKKAAADGEDENSASLAASQMQTSTTPRTADPKPDKDTRSAEDQKPAKTEKADDASKSEAATSASQTGTAVNTNQAAAANQTPVVNQTTSGDATTPTTSSAAASVPSAAGQSPDTAQNAAGQAAQAPIQSAQTVDPAALQAALSAQTATAADPTQAAAATQAEASASQADQLKPTVSSPKADVKPATQALSGNQTTAAAGDKQTVVIPVQGVSSSDAAAQSGKQATPVTVTLKAKAGAAEASATTSSSPAATQPAPSTSATGASQPILQTSASQAVATEAKANETQAADVIRQIVSQADELTKATKPVVHIQLYPEDLGKIDLKVTSSSRGIAITLTADQNSTSKMLENHLGSLRQALTEAGVQLNNLGMGGSGSNLAQSRQQGQAFQTRIQTPGGANETKFETVTAVKENVKTASMVDYRV
jgi:flagellar hook-length control protein FliK